MWKSGLETRRGESERSWAWRREEEKENYGPQGCLTMGFFVRAGSGLRASYSVKGTFEV